MRHIRSSSKHIIFQSRLCKQTLSFVSASFFVNYAGNGAKVCSTFTGISQLKRATVNCYGKFDHCYQKKLGENEAILSFSTHTKPELGNLSLVILLRFSEDFHLWSLTALQNFFLQKHHVK